MSSSKLRYRVALRSPVAIEHLELVHNGKVVKSFTLRGDRQTFDADGEIAVDRRGWLLLRAWNQGADPQVLDLYPYATTSPIYIDLPGSPPTVREDAAFFIAWLDRVIADASNRVDYRNARERDATLAYLRDAKRKYEGLARPQ